MRFEIVGMVDGEERIVVEHVTRLRDEDAPDWPQGEGYRIVIEGEPHVHLELGVSLRPRRPQPRRLPGHRHARRQRHPRTWCAAEPGVLTMLDLPVYSANVGG